MTLLDIPTEPTSAETVMPPAERDHELETALERHRRELHLHCYRMLGSYTDAEDLVQETLTKAWRHRDDFEPGTNARAWLYRIATNVCIDAIRARDRQLSRFAGSGEVTWLEPYPDALLDELSDASADPEAAAVTRETIELVFIVAIQALPARQRAVLLLSSALGWSPEQVASVLGMSRTAVNSALQRARATLRERLGTDRSRWQAPSLSDDERATLRSFIAFHEHGDAAAAAALTREDVVTTMPPDPKVLHGKAEWLPLLDVAFGPSGLGDWRLVPVGANRLPAAASYLRRPGDALFRAFKLDVLRVIDGQVAEATVFDARVFDAFGLPPVWSEELREASFAKLGGSD